MGLFRFLRGLVRASPDATAPQDVLSFGGLAIDTANLRVSMEFGPADRVMIEVVAPKGRTLRKYASGDDAEYLRWLVAGVLDDGCLPANIRAA